MVGTTKFNTTLSTLRSGRGMLERMFSDEYLANGITAPQEDGFYFIDRDAISFGQILRYLQTWNVAVFEKASWPVTRKELEYYTTIGLTKIDAHMTGINTKTFMDMLEQSIDNWNNAKLSRRVVKKTTTKVAPQFEVRTYDDNVLADITIGPFLSNYEESHFFHLLKQLGKLLCGAEWERTAINTFVADAFGAETADVTVYDKHEQEILDTVDISLEWPISILSGVDGEKSKNPK